MWFPCNIAVNRRADKVKLFFYNWYKRALFYESNNTKRSSPVKRIPKCHPPHSFHTQCTFFAILCFLLQGLCYGWKLVQFPDIWCTNIQERTQTSINLFFNRLSQHDIVLCIATIWADTRYTFWQITLDAENICTVLDCWALWHSRILHHSGINLCLLIKSLSFRDFKKLGWWGWGPRWYRFRWQPYKVVRRWIV